MRKVETDEDCPICSERSRPEKRISPCGPRFPGASPPCLRECADSPLRAVVSGDFRRWAFVAINPKMEYVSVMEQNNSTSQASQAAPAHSPAPKAQPIRKFSTASAAEKTAVLVQWLEESKARDLVALDVAGKSPCMDVVVVVTASSLRHAKSLADGLMEQCTKNNYEFLRMEGYQTGQWILSDLNDVVVHIFQQDMRELFRIESLWKDAPVLYGETSAPARHEEPVSGDED